MKLLIRSFILLVLLSGGIGAQETHNTLDSNTAFFAGDSLSYVILPPDNYCMVTDMAIEDGYSFAFVPDSTSYDSAVVIIGVNIFQVKQQPKREFTLDDLIHDDTISLRSHFGEDLIVSEVEPIETDGGHMLRTLYLNFKTTFIPNVMMSYFDGDSEVIIFDLSVSDKIPRFEAERDYLDCLKKFKALRKADLESSDDE